MPTELVELDEGVLVEELFDPLARRGLALACCSRWRLRPARSRLRGTARAGRRAGRPVVERSGVSLESPLTLPGDAQPTVGGPPRFLPRTFALMSTPALPRSRAAVTSTGGVLDVRSTTGSTNADLLAAAPDLPDGRWW